MTSQLKRTLASTNPCESIIETVRRTSRNVKRWKSLAKLTIAGEHDVAAKRAAAFTSQPLNASLTAAPEVAATTV